MDDDEVDEEMGKEGRCDGRSTGRRTVDMVGLRRNTLRNRNQFYRAY